MPDTITLALKAAQRAGQLLRVLDREHKADDLHRAARAVRHEVETVQDLLSAFGQDITNPREGKATDGAPETSQAAARAIRTRSGSQRHEILRALHVSDQAMNYGMTDYQIQATLAMSPNSQRPRRLELVHAGYVTAAKDVHGVPRTRKAPESGLDCQVWQITPRGRVALDVLAAGQMAIAFPGDGQ